MTGYLKAVLFHFLPGLRSLRFKTRLEEICIIEQHRGAEGERKTIGFAVQLTQLRRSPRSPESWMPIHRRNDILQGFCVEIVNRKIQAIECNLGDVRRGTCNNIGLYLELMSVEDTGIGSISIFG